jgi:hypothetical protein
MHTAVAVFSGKSTQTVFRDGGTQSWRLVPANASKHEFVVCCRSAVDWAEGTEERGSAFIVGRLAAVVKSTENMPGRYLLKFSEYAEVAVPGAWKGWRNPVRYTTLEELGIHLATLNFKPMPAPEETGPSSNSSSEVAPIAVLTIAQAKVALANHYGVAPDAVEITIRG